MSLAALLAGLFAGGLGTVGLVVLLGGGVLGVFLGMALLAPRLVTPLARIVGWPARRRGIAGELAGANAVRNPGRTASTAAALMIGLTLVTLVAVLASSLGAAGTAAHRRRRSTPATSSTARTTCRSGPPRATRWRACRASRAPRTSAPTRC